MRLKNWERDECMKKNIVEQNTVKRKTSVKVRGYTLLTVCIYVLMCITLFASSVYIGHQFMENYKKDLLIHQCDVLDRTLAIYAKMQQAVRTDSVRFDEEKNLTYTHTRIFPESLKDLGTIQDEQGYFSKEIDFSQFTYTVKKNVNGSMTYKLGVTLPDGKFYTSPQSDKEL